MRVKTIEYVNNCMRILDQTRLPEKEVYLELNKVEEIHEAIYKLRVRGAPAIGVAAALGAAVCILKEDSADKTVLYKRLLCICEKIASSRPTAVNLFWALDRIRKIAQESLDSSEIGIKESVLKEALLILEEDEIVCQRIGEEAVKLIKDGDSILTHCNAGSLATAGIGTALAGVYIAHRAGKKIKVFSCETRPLLQGSRLTCWELMQEGISVTLICDNVAPLLMRDGKVDLIITGADRIAANGDTANKVGTYSHSQMARIHSIPFYIAAPVSTIDLSLDSGDKIPIEERFSEEVTCGFGKRTAPEKIDVYSPSFDVTPFSFISGIITEAGIARPPYAKSLPEMVAKAKEWIKF
ncbi:MAG: S-methyl-5-thioribose-1-phosphate isomerase [Candidatus Theseobacter exili]|nr:S-methyl-5-thioribose-1-phosphate isomerase [Candidatus Theseobacter exili]